VRRSVCAGLICLFASTAFAEREPWYRGAAGRKRLLHLSITAGATLAYLGASFAVDTPDRCRWCAPPAIDEGLRDLVVWEDTRRADVLSSIDAYVVAPVVGVGLLILSDHDAGLPRFLDDTIPVAETVAITQLVVRVIKVAVARERPFVRFGSEVAISTDNNLSFPSGHSSLGFAITASAGMICHWRRYWTEPYVWGSGIALSVTTEYLRMAADKHYFTDVLLGGAMGLAGGLLIPRLMRENVAILPMQNGVAMRLEF
jgi:hypothetical protein